MKKSVILVAGGSGVRMGNTIPKQFLLLNSLPVLMHSIKRFYDYDQSIEIIVVLPASENERWKELIAKYSFKIPHSAVNGGISRFQSVKNGLEKVRDNYVVAIHDGVRPLCSIALIKRCFEEAEKLTNAIPSIRASDSLREFALGSSFNIDREKIRIIQTPQCFHSSLLKKAYAIAEHENFTDDAGVFEAAGNKIHLVEGEKSNIKITEQIDLLVASAIAKENFPDLK